MLGYMADTKKILNNHEQRIADMDIFLANTNASLKNLETRVGQLTLSLQKQSKDTFPSDTQKKPQGLFGSNTKEWQGTLARKIRKKLGMKKL